MDVLIAWLHLQVEQQSAWLGISCLLLLLLYFQFVLLFYLNKVTASNHFILKAFWPKNNQFALETFWPKTL